MPRDKVDHANELCNEIEILYDTAYDEATAPEVVEETLVKIEDLEALLNDICGK